MKFKAIAKEKEERRALEENQNLTENVVAQQEQVDSMKVTTQKESNTD